MMAALREAVGPGVEIMVDFHARPASVAAALAYIEALAPGRPMFVEEPLTPGDTAGLAALAARTSVPLATGERLIDRIEFDELFRSRAVSIAQPDICHVGGLLEAKKIAAMADAASIGLAPHNPLGPIAGAAALHFAVSTPNHVIQEEMVGAVPWYGEVVQRADPHGRGLLAGARRPRPRGRGRRGGRGAPPVQAGGSARAAPRCSTTARSSTGEAAARRLSAAPGSAAAIAIVCTVVSRTCSRCRR